MSSTENTATPLLSPATGRKSCTTFTQLFVEHRRIAGTAGSTRKIISYHLSQNRRFLRSLELDESADPLFIADEDAFRRETGGSIAALGLVDGSPGARSLRSAVGRVRATFLLRHEGTPISAAPPESFRAFWPAFLHFGTIAFKLGYLGTFPSNSKSFAGLPRHANANLLRYLGIRDGTVSALKKGIHCALSGAMEELLAALLRDYEGYTWEMTPYDKAFNCRRQVFFELMAIVPHRVRLWAVLARRNFSERIDATGSRCYHLHIENADFKNHRYLKLDYDLTLPVRLTALLDTYFAKAWCILNAPIGTIGAWRDENSGKAFLRDGCGAMMSVSKDHRHAILMQITPSDRVFGFTFGASLKQAERVPLTAIRKTKRIIESLQRLTVNNTGRFLGDKYKTNGFYPHAFRHIGATAEIKTTGSYERAALLLGWTARLS